MARWTPKNGTLIVRDASSPPIELVVDTGPGDFTVDGFEANEIEATAVVHRGRHEGLLPGAERTGSIKFTAELRNESASHATQKRLQDALRKLGAFKNGVSTDPARLVWAVEIILVLDDGAGNQDALHVPCVRPQFGVAEDMAGNKVNVTGTSYVIEVPSRGRKLAYWASEPTT